MTHKNLHIFRLDHPLLMTGTILAISLTLKLFLYKTAELSESSYFASFIFFELLLNSGYLLLFAGGLLSASLIFARLNLSPLQTISGKNVTIGKYFLKNLFQEWRIFQHSRSLRLFVTAVAVILTWIYATYSINVYYNQSHWIDRVLLILLCLGVYWRPIFVVPFLLVAVAIISQFNYPLQVGFDRPTDNLLLYTLLLFSGYFIFFALTEIRNPAGFVFLTICLIAGQYWYPGLGKLELNWFAHGNVYLILANAYTHGWLAFLPEETLSEMTIFFSQWDSIMVISTAIVEIGALFCLWRLNVLKFFIVSWICFHCGVFVLTGFFFWKWILLEITFWVIFLRKQNPIVTPLFNWRYFAMSVVLIAAIPYWARPAKLAWYDTKLAYTYRFSGLDTQDRQIELPPSFFAPYDAHFIFGAFGYLTETPQLVGPYGASQTTAISRALNAAQTPGDIFALEAQKKARRPESAMIDRFEDYIKTTAGNYSHRQNKALWLNWLQPPATFWSFAEKVPLTGKEQPVAIKITQVTSFFDGNAYQEIRERVIRKIDVRH